jgi:hypothetical protein
VRITSCVPLAGQGVIARHGALVAVTDGAGPGPDALLTALAEAAAATGDGADLVLRAARAALGGHGHPAWACAGVTADGGVGGGGGAATRWSPSGSTGARRSRSPPATRSCR